MPILHNKYDTPELIDPQFAAEDPVILYLVVKESLNMSIGKTAAQCGHAVQYFMMKFLEIQTLPTKDEPTNFLLLTAQEWLSSSFRKVVLRANDSKFERLKEELPCLVVHDAGLTEIPNGSETVLALWPMLKSQAPKLVKQLRVL